MRQLSYRFEDEDPDWPVLSATCTTEERTGRLTLGPLLCRIRLASVANTLDDYELLESPRVRLCDLPDATELFREEEFRPAELIEEGTWTDLPCDVGFFPQEPGILLWTYPNDTPEHILGVPRPGLELECRIRGQLCSFTVPLPPLGRGCSKEVELIIDGPDDYRYRVWDSPSL